MKTTDYQVGDKVYYTGDMANLPDAGEIINRHEPDRFAPINYDIKLDDGRIIKGLYHLHFENSPGRRFWLMEEWEADRKAKLEAFMSKYSTITSSGR